MRRVVLAALLAACGPGLAGQDTYRNPRVQDFGAQLTQASQKHDVAGVRALLRDSVTIGGLWFADLECAKQFGVAREIRPQPSLPTVTTASGSRRHACTR